MPGLCLGLALLSAALPAAAESPAAPATALPAFTPGGTAHVAQILDGRSLRLADGRQVVLVDITVPQPRPGADWLARQERQALATLIGTGPITLRYAGAPHDRYGRVLAQLFAAGRWIQGALLRRGLARVRGRADERLGLREMLAIENAARVARRGLWRFPSFAVRDAATVGRDVGTFQIVTGTVAATAMVRGVAYVNFGADWRTAFSLRITGAALAMCRTAGLDPRALTGTRLRVRGFIEGGRRPLMDILFPEQIERLAASP